eukprot:TRINITY_DN8185_c0_g1_i1.p1 TRINITY_DN8185_c0_g1~~TRINITY_DN8185_c0_g1_i1.p1  ORF type:complete len:255 (-),score=88.93 TRINITY_DN8185_c0_g1_i1:149-913(-)
MSNNQGTKADPSKSLYNYSLSPGWSTEEVQVLRKLLMKFGVGRWKAIMRSGALPGKSNSQLNIQTQRLLGQQTIAEFMGINLDCQKVWEKNQKKQGPDFKRKAGLLINTGSYPSKEARDKKQKENKKQFGLSKEEVDAIELPDKEELEEVRKRSKANEDKIVTEKSIKEKKLRRKLNIVNQKIAVVNVLIQKKQEEQGGVSNTNKKRKRVADDEDIYKTDESDVEEDTSSKVEQKKKVVTKKRRRIEDDEDETD